MLAISPISILEATLKSEWIDIFIREQLIDASFHVPAKACKSTKKGALIAYLEEGKSLIAIPDKHLSYTFGKLECNTGWSKAKDIEQNLEPDDIRN